MEMKYPKRCACCQLGEINEMYETCEICGWISDPAQETDRSLKNGKNEKSLDEYYKNFTSNYGMCFCAE